MSTLSAEVLFVKQYYSRESSKRSGRISFFLVMLLCTAMIGASCWFAYTQTAKDITLEIDSITDLNSRLAAAVPETGVVRPTEPRPTQAATRPAEQIILPTQSHTETVTETIHPDAQETALPAQPVVIPARMPCNGEIVQPYSDGELVKSATTGVWQTHNGVDISAAPGDPVYPMQNGIVTEIREDALWGVCVTVDHQNGYFSRYCGLNPGLKVNEGDTVTPNEEMGIIGSGIEIESALPSHLHFELRQGDMLIDPVSYLKNLQ